MVTGRLHALGEHTAHLQHALSFACGCTVVDLMCRPVTSHASYLLAQVLQVPPPPCPPSNSSGAGHSQGSGGPGEGEGQAGLAKSSGMVMSVQLLAGDQDPCSPSTYSSSSLQGEPAGQADNPGSSAASDHARPTSSTHTALPPACCLLAGYEAGCVALWDCRSLREPFGAVWGAHSEPVLSLSVSPGGHAALSGSADSTVCCYSLGQAVTAEAGASEEGQAQSEAAGATASAAADKGRTAPVAHSKATLSLTKQLALSQPGVGDIGWRSDGRILALGCWDGKVRGGGPVWKVIPCMIMLRM